MSESVLLKDSGMRAILQAAGRDVKLLKIVVLDWPRLNPLD
jgi:hypothetical protein